MNSIQAIAITAILMSVANVAAAQSVRIRETPDNLERRQKVALDDDNASDEKKLDLESYAANDNPAIIQDTAYYEYVQRFNSWLVGIGDSLTYDEAKKRLRYYRFTMKNDKGHWQHIETMSGDSRAIDYGGLWYFSYKESGNSESNDDVKDAINNISQWFEICDLDGENIVEERTYNTDGDLLFTLQFNKTRQGKVMVSYVNKNGFPIDFCVDNRYNYGSVAAITYDSHGRDHLIVYLDGAGYSRPSTRGTYMMERHYDDDHFIKSTRTLNVSGTPMDNSCGVCYLEWKYDEKHISGYLSYYDKYHKPVRNNDTDDTSIVPNNFQTRYTECDDTGIPINILYYFENDGILEKDEINGIHQTRWDPTMNVYKTYNLKGDLVE